MHIIAKPQPAVVVTDQRPYPVIVAIYSVAVITGSLEAAKSLPFRVIITSALAFTAV